MKVLRFLLLIVSLNFAAEVPIIKPSPCYKVEKIIEKEGALEVHLRREKHLCPQVIVEEKIKIKGEVEELEIFIEGKLWRRERID